MATPTSSTWGRYVEGLPASENNSCRRQHPKNFPLRPFRRGHASSGGIGDCLYAAVLYENRLATGTDQYRCAWLAPSLAQRLLGVDISKEQQTSDWGTDRDLSDAQRAYAAADVLYLHDLKQRLDTLLAREGRTHLAQACFEFLPTR